MAYQRAMHQDADGGDLLAGGPDARQPGLARFRFDPQLPQVFDERTLEHLDVAGDGEAKAGTVEDRVADQLARAVIGRLAAAIGPDDLDPTPRPLALIPQHVAAARRLAHGEDMRVLEQQESVILAAFPQGGDHLGLEIPGRAVAGTTQPGA